MLGPEVEWDQQDPFLDLAPQFAFGRPRQTQGSGGGLLEGVGIQGYNVPTSDKKKHPGSKCSRKDSAGGWYEGKDFSNDWFTMNIVTWLRVLDPYKSRSLEILEIGSWEGRSAIAFLEMLPLCTLTCVDKFGGEPADPNDLLRREQFLRMEGRFDRNTAQYAPRLTKMKGPASAMLDTLAQNKRRFDIIHIDRLAGGVDIAARDRNTARPHPGAVGRLARGDGVDVRVVVVLEDPA